MTEIVAIFCALVVIILAAIVGHKSLKNGWWED